MTQAIVAARTTGGSVLYCTGLAGHGWLSENESEAFMEADSKKTHEIEELLLPRSRSAEAAVQRALRRRPRADQ